MMQSSTMHIFEMMLTGATSQSRVTAGFFNTDYALRLFSGPRPTQAQIASMTTATTSEAVYTMSRLPAVLTSLGSTVVATTSVAAGSVLPVGMQPNKITLAFSQIGLQLSSLSDEPPTWGLVYFFPKSANANPDSWTAYALLYFTVGDVGSGADLIIPGGVLPRFNVWKPGDFEINMVNAIK